ncbi:hypothetical protein LINPERPRIM_LOCUS26765 [Linum perenne]
MSKNAEEIESEIESIRPWSDLDWGILNSIYSMLQRTNDHDDARLGFGSVCRNWHQIHADKPKVIIPNPQQPGTTRIGGYIFRVGAILNRNTIDRVWGAAMPMEIRKQLENSKIAYIWDSGWWLLQSAYSIIGCFNPLLHWPSSYIRLPRLCCYFSPPRDSNRPRPPPFAPIIAGFSAFPSSTSSDWTLLVVHTRSDNRSTFSTISCGQRRWKNYLHGCHVVGVSVGYREGKFYVLYETGDVLIFGIDGAGADRTMLVADRSSAVQSGANERMMVTLPAHPFSTKEMCCRVEILRVVGKSIAVSWMRVKGCGRLRLVRVETEERMLRRLRNSEGEGTVVLLARKEVRNYVIENEVLCTCGDLP